MERITKVFFDPLATSKAQIKAILEELPVGSAHPFSPERLLLLRTASGIDEIDISAYPEKHFFNAVDLGELGETLQTRMTRFSSRLRLFNDEYTVQQVPGPTFKVPIESNEIAILALSERRPTYYDLCVADNACKTSCYSARTTFPGLVHSGDINDGINLLHHMKISGQLSEEKEFAVFVSGYSYTKLTKYRERNPVVMIANHAEKALYIVPVPLDAASIGDATICSPVVFRREGASLTCSILPAPTTDIGKICTGSSLSSTSFSAAIQRAQWAITPPVAQIAHVSSSDSETPLKAAPTAKEVCLPSAKRNGVFVTQTTELPPLIDLDKTQVIRFGNGLEFIHEMERVVPETEPSAVVLPCILGFRLEGPLLLATGTSPNNVPFADVMTLHAYYENLKSMVIFVDERMTDNARNLATSWRINAVFVIQMASADAPREGDATALLNLVNINSVTALAGPQSLVLVKISEKYYFYRGLANQSHLKTSELDFGSDVTETVQAAGLESLLDPRAQRIVNLSESCAVLLPTSGDLVQPEDLKSLFENFSLGTIHSLESDIPAIVPQLQVILNQKELADLSRALITILSTKVHNVTAPFRDAYVKFLKNNFSVADPESIKKKNSMLSDFRKSNKGVQKSLETIISQLSNLISTQTTSKRTHDLQRLQRQAAIQNNVEAVKSMTFGSLAAMLESQAEEMGVLLLNIDTTSYKQLLGHLKEDTLDVSPCCDLDSRIIHLEGFDAGIIMEQSQSSHDGPLTHQLGPSHPILALPYLSQERGSGSMLAWVCWDEFVNLKSPFKVRWMEKCNDAHIAAVRIIMRDTLSNAVVSREHNLQPGSPEIGQLMSALLMAAMSKLASKKTTAPTRSINAQDTVTKLMRGMFGNLLSIAGSGVRPLSMVWQLFGQEPKLEVPPTPVAWSWYETVVRLYPFSGWPQGQLNLNLERLLDKAFIAVITKSELTEKLKSSRADDMIKYCQLRNIQLVHSRTFVTIFIRMINSDVDRKAIATRLLDVLPPSLEKQTESYKRMMRYLQFVASTGLRREEDDVVVVGVYLKRSAVFKTLKQAVATACRSEDKAEIKKSCLALLKKFNEIAENWELPNAKLIMQNVKAYQGLLDTHFVDDEVLDESTSAQRKGFMKQVLSDAEKTRIPWRVGKEGEYESEPLDEALVQEIMTGKEFSHTTSAGPPHSETQITKKDEGMGQFSSIVNAHFIDKVDTAVTLQDVCLIMNIPVSAMRVFASALNPGFDLEKNVGENFRQASISLLLDRKERENQQPIRALFEMEKTCSKSDALLEIEF